MRLELIHMALEHEKYQKWVEHLKRFTMHALEARTFGCFGNRSPTSADRQSTGKPRFTWSMLKCLPEFEGVFWEFLGCLLDSDWSGVNMAGDPRHGMKLRLGWSLGRSRHPKPDSQNMHHCIIKSVDMQSNITENYICVQLYSRWKNGKNTNKRPEAASFCKASCGPNNNKGISISSFVPILDEVLQSLPADDVVQSEQHSPKVPTARWTRLAPRCVKHVFRICLGPR